jgi:hypothetical protein
LLPGTSSFLSATATVGGTKRGITDRFRSTAHGVVAMKRALVVEGSELTKKLVREVGELAAGVDAELLL